MSNISLSFRDALKIGTLRILGTFTNSDRFNCSPGIYIPLPDNLEEAQAAVSAVGHGSSVEDLK